MPDRYDSTRKTWEAIWQTASVAVELETADYPRARAIFDAYLPFLDRDQIVLEAGSGLSAALIPLRDRGFRVIGVDYAINALATSRAYDATLTLTAGDVHALPLASASVGAYLSFGVFEHFESGMARPLAEAYRVLRRGGTLVLTIPYPNLIHRLIAWRRARGGSSPLTDDSFYESTYTRDQLIGEVTRAGFTLCQALPTSHAFTLWGLGGVFRAPGYYRTSRLADALGGVLRRVAPWEFNFTTLIIARKD